jgi:hypothetical protein
MEAQKRLEQEIATSQSRLKDTTAQLDSTSSLLKDTQV